MNDIHPDVQAALDAARELRNRIADLRERMDAIKARRPSPSGLVVPEVDAMGRLTTLYLAPGTAARFDNDELTAEIMAAIRESTADAARQYRTLMDADPWAEPDTAEPESADGTTTPAEVS
ncbi:YbaB/EbfC family nucleoid-associated protein [Nocardia sp. NEAU-G5]|uniref:YbaB/EbfC family nucleoid-associated protein n=1 Tax=Nocardia albiluteola TaxID=2842303 RepID=A0ABS6B942_9NOCA|nr:YbaB/EbfC family nucleoid-associated protein [Nocardia albiluteola]MBU3066812.1 YbaB/EbfC family nucleoid-associated protein [Nocardia albiluteola]